MTIVQLLFHFSLFCQHDTIVANQHLDSGRVLIKNEQYDKAIAILDSAASVYLQNEIYDKYIITQNNRGLAYIYKKMPDSAISILNKCIDSEFKNEPEAEKHLAETHYKLVYAYSFKENIQMLIFHCEKYLDLTLKYYSDTSFNAASAYNSTGFCYDVTDQKDTAIYYYKKSLEIYKALNNKSRIASTSNNLGACYSDLNKLNKSLRYYEFAIETRKEMNDSAGIAQSYSNIGVIYHKQDKYDKALKYFKKSIKWSTIE